MLKNYFFTTWRNLKKNPVFSFINIAGLAMGLTVCMFIVEYVTHENSYDKFHSNADRTYWIQTKVKLNTDSFFTSSIDYRLSGMAKDVSPFIENFLRTKHEDANAIVQNVSNPSLKFAEPAFMFADTNFFRFFSFKLLQGNKETVLNNPSSVVITQQAAHKYFGNDNPVGKTLRYNNTYNFIVSGVAASLPSNSSIRFDFVAPISSLMSINHIKDSLPPNETNFTTYFLLHRQGDAPLLENTLQRLDKAQQEQNQVFIRFLAIPFTDTHLNSNFGDSANTKYLRVFPFVAGLILLLALINYMSLSTARATIRAKEIGVRKVLGAGRGTIAGQFFVESAVITACAFALAYLLCLALQPAFFRYLEIDIDYSFLYGAPMLLAFACLFFLSVVLAATYPSLLLSAYEPVKVLYGRLSKQAGGMTVRRFFTIFQFTVSVVLIICGIVIHQQMYFIQHTDTGVNRSNVVMVPFTPSLGKHLAAFKAENKALSGIEQVCAAKYAMYKGYDISVIKPEKGDGFITYPTLAVDQNFISMLDLQWKEPPLTPLYYREKNASVINEAAVEKFGLGPRAINKSMSGAFTISGVLKDFNYQSLQGKIGPLVISFVNDDDSSTVWAHDGGSFFAKIKPHVNTAAVLDQMKTIYKKYETEVPFEYVFMDDAFNAMYKIEARLSKIFTAFTLFTIVIACLGLLGLSTFMATQRTKEIGIRKVLGATAFNIAYLMSKDFVRLVLIAVVLASPVAWWAMHAWLQSFAYRIPIGWWIFAVTAIGTICVALITIAYQALRSAVANPVKSLRAE